MRRRKDTYTPQNTQDLGRWSRQAFNPPVLLLQNNQTVVKNYIVEKLKTKLPKQFQQLQNS